MTSLNQLYNNFGAKKVKVRVGRGIGSGKGKTCGVGVKGQKARSGVAIKGFEGGQMPIIKRLPKRGFNSFNRKKYITISVADVEALIIDQRIPNIDLIDKESLIQAGLIKNSNVLVKLLANGENINKKINIKFDAYSAKAKKIIEEAGGQVF